VSDTIAVRMSDAGKRYTKYEDNPMLITAALQLRTRTRRSKLWAVRHVDLEVPQGECFGVIGRNGSGKSTMLSMLAGVTAPSEGAVAIRGRVAPLISVGVGFHPELTGRENVYVNATILGLLRNEIDAKLEEIVDFAEIENFIDTPVKFYSSGMVVRLGFSVAVQARPDVLLVDEVLAVGDVAFQAKCGDQIKRIRDVGTTVVVVSHNLNMVRQMCARAMLLHEGEVKFSGETPDAITLYHDILNETREPEDDPARQKVLSGVAEITGLELLNSAGEVTGFVKAGEEVALRVEAKFDQAVEDPVVGLIVATASGSPVYYDDSHDRHPGQVVAGGSLSCLLKLRADFPTGTYSVTVTLRSGFAGPQLSITKPLSFYVDGRPLVHGVADFRVQFELSSSAPRSETDAVLQRRGQPDP